MKTPDSDPSRHSLLAMIADLAATFAFLYTDAVCFFSLVLTKTFVNDGCTSRGRIRSLRRLSGLYIHGVLALEIERCLSSEASSTVIESNVCVPEVSFVVRFVSGHNSESTSDTTIEIKHNSQRCFIFDVLQWAT
ncbi:hypothetical protein BV22DRAFT_185270 [Leucogyrophana mollusca]|uniref:Uncharacterized protein n=1 Tax=Leucogyrophana mollusca TaxID=85980 RepID=A0ACB8BUD1_9AGAM|nr:hypothetical protein BV22DRAFT_185270 [Leucogyrophana mollusca]